MAGSPLGKPAARKPAAYDDIEAACRDGSCADSCTSLDDYGRACNSPATSSTSSDDGVLEWQPDVDPSPPQPQSSGWRCRGGSLAAVCLLLTLFSFLGPDSQQRASTIVRRAAALSSDFGSRVHEDAAYHSSALIAKLKGERHCRAPPSVLRTNTTAQRLRVAGMTETYKVEKPEEHGQWLVSARLDGLLSIMTPVYPDEETLALLLNQLRSANQFLNMDTIKEWVFVTPKAKVPRLVNFLEEELVTLPCVLARKMRVVADETCAPELAPKALKRIAAGEAGSIDGWYKQQLVKLACSFTIKTPYVLITDADTFFLSNVQALDLMHQEEGCTPDSGVCDLQKQVQFQARNEMANVWTAGEVEQEAWIARSASVLNISISMPEGGVDTMGVTPQIMSRGVLNSMAAHMENLASNGESWREYLLRIHVAQLRDPQMKTHAGWTEYDLYWTFANHTGLWDKFHLKGYLQRPEANLWWEEQYTTWDPCARFDDAERDQGYWAVVQSRLNISPALIWEKLAPCMQHSIANARNITAENAANSVVKDAKEESDTR